VLSAFNAKMQMLWFGKIIRPARECDSSIPAHIGGKAMRVRNAFPVLSSIGGVVMLATFAQAAEFYVGEPIEQDDMQIVPNYLVGVKMNRMPPGAEMAADSIHLEADVHATKNEKHGFPEDAWIPYLTIRFTITKDASAFKKSGTLAPMTAVDGPHYANNVRMAGPGTYRLTYEIFPPSSNGFIHHVDKASGVPDWWKPITAHWTFTYPSKEKG
jgi:periplasmic iron binding protein